MKTVVFAYHSMGVLGIKKLLENGFSILQVFTHEDDPNENVWFGSVRKLCEEHGIDCLTPTNPNTDEWLNHIRKVQPDIIFSFYYRYMLSTEILETAPLGAYNLHGSFLPRYRGRCPVNWVLVNGEKQTGVTLHEMVSKPDAGGIVAQKQVAIDFEDTARSLFAKIEQTAGLLLDDVLPDMRSGNIKAVPMDLSQGSYFSGRKPEDGHIDWQRPSHEIYNLIRAVTRPYPGAFSFANGKKIIFWWAKPAEGISQTPGLIEETDKKRIVVHTGKGLLLPLEIEVDDTVLKGGDLTTYLTSLKKGVLV